MRSRSDMATAGERARAWLLGALPVAAFVILRWLLETGLVDDTYIFMRYAENVARGLGPVFNAGERVEGFTSPLWTALLALPAFLGLDLRVVAPLLGGLLGAAAIAVVARASSPRLGGVDWLPALVPAWFLATDPSFVFWCWTGMDSALFAFLFVAGFVLFLRELPGSGPMSRTGFAWLLAATARLEFLVVVPALLVLVVWSGRADRRARSRKLVTLLAPLSLLAPLFGARWLYYGTLLPNTFQAKAGVPGGLLLASGTRYLWDAVVAYGPLLALILLHAGWSLLRRRRLSVDRTAALLVLVSWAAYATLVGGDHFPLFRFYVPAIPILALALRSSLEEWRDHPVAGRGPAAVVVALLALAIVSALAFRIHRDHGGAEAAREVWMARRWAEVGRWFADHVPSDSSLASVVVGAIPYCSGLRTYDLLGLTDAHVARRGRVYEDGAVGHQKYDTDYVLERRPDYIVFPTSGLLREPRRQIGQRHAYALYDLANDPRTRSLYRYRAIRMPDGYIIELLTLR